MRADQSKDFAVKERYRHREEMISGQRNVQRGKGGPVFPELSIADLLRRLVLNISKLYVAIKYQVYKLTASFLEGSRLPWFKLGLVALAVFIILKKDVQFSINMRSPLGIAGDDQDSGADAMSMAQTVGWRSGGGVLVAVEDLDEGQVRAYVRRFTKVAVAEMEKFGMPASVKMAQGILESRAGEDPGARKNNNHFGLPLAGRAYDSAWENWRAHSVFLQENFPDLFQLGGSYKKWARALDKMDYNQDGEYSKKIVEIIEKYQLYLLDEG